MRAPRAVIFDMDDTLYPERRFVLSGCVAVARSLRQRLGVDAREAFGVLVGAVRRGRRRTALQHLCRRYALPDTLVAELVEVIRAHTPRLRLPMQTRRVLQALRPGWRLGVLTNGVPAIQARKVRALGIEPLVDHVVFAAEHGTGCGKPERAPFVTLAARLDVPPDRCVVVGDDPVCDVGGARGAGMWSVRVGPFGRHATPPAADGVVADSTIARLSELPLVAAALLDERSGRFHEDRSSRRRC